MPNSQTFGLLLFMHLLFFINNKDVFAIITLLLHYYIVNLTFFIHLVELNLIWLINHIHFDCVLKQERAVPAEMFPQWHKSFDSLILQIGFDITIQIIIVVALKRVEMAEILNAVIL